MEVKHFSIEKLNGIYSYSIPIVDNKLVLVGENGTGKSTLLSILNCILSRQWHKLFDYDFKSATITIDSSSFSFNYRELKEYEAIENNFDKSRVDHYVRRAIRAENINIDNAISDYDLQTTLLNHLSFKTHIKISSKALERTLLRIYEQQEVKSENSVAKLDQFIRKKVLCPVIYLPTYRRIERELESIFPELENKLYRSTEYGIKDLKKNHYQTELVEFGMGDVKNIIKESLDGLEQSFRDGIKKLTADYLQDIFLHRHENFDYTSLSSIDAPDLEKMLSRIDAETLSGDIKETIKNNILGLNNGELEKTSESDKVITYFISKLIEFHAEQSEKETSIKRFISTCNSYLVGKQLQFNSVKFEIKIYHIDEGKKVIGNKTIPFEKLSSGEKQIVSLFSHLHLSNRKEFIIIIDEPELSLSVKWQRTFLEDIVSTGTCLGLFSVTHSPFVYDNSLDRYARSIGEFMERTA